MNFSLEEIARVAHAANIEMQAIGGDDMPSVPWLYEPRSVRASALKGVERVRNGMTPQENHEHWCRYKTAQGWTRGEKDPEKMTHPCLVPWDELPERERMKALLFHAVVLALSGSGS